jgi:copper chaperone
VAALTAAGLIHWRRKEKAMQTATLNISGMTCGGCVRSVSNVLKALDGVVKADVSLEKKCAVVDYDASKLSPAQLKRAVEEAGYEVAG